MSDYLVTSVGKDFVDRSDRDDLKSSTTPPPAATPIHASKHTTFDLRESLDWLLRADADEEIISPEEGTIRRERRFELLLWLLHLEPRLGPYPEPQVS